MKTIYHWSQTVVLLLSLSSTTLLEAKSNHPVLAIYGQYHTLQEHNNSISPYIVALYALDILRESKEREQIANFILWYARHTNKIDKFGVTGTVYDYTIDSNGTEYPQYRYDSADGYAGLYLYLVAEYYRKTHDKKLLKSVWKTLEDNAYLILHLQEEDGLTRALPQKEYRQKFLMDNVESFIGAESFLYLAQEMDVNASLYVGLRYSLKLAIMRELYNKEKQTFYWVKNDKGRTAIDNSTFYPGTFAQIHLLAFWGKELDHDITKRLWHDILHTFSKSEQPFAMEQLIIFHWARLFALQESLGQH